ncbi:hypothetical protein BIW11_11647 [Tropilaelaps mercedesae]|uniref:Uncharacterized protein n=1 Tax=Tropilaelaps mercedesae TaxID=418985 RepID=A0A1V9XAH3_9ACAR|nr:hypothetical protein BIW11_11647 [Tropilaelaps mercedesae]
MLVGGFSNINCSDTDVLEAITVANLELRKVYCATIQMASGIKYVIHTNFDGFCCRVPVW